MEAAAKREKEKQVIQEMIPCTAGNSIMVKASVRNVKRFAGMHISA